MDIAIFDYFYHKSHKSTYLNDEINISDLMDHFDIYIKIHQGTLLAQKNQNKH